MLVKGSYEMTIRKKNRRKIVVASRKFVWWVCDMETDWAFGPTLTVASEDKRFIVRRYLTHTSEPSYLVVIGSEFPGLTGAGGCWRRVQCPVWKDSPMITPIQVRQLIEWCLSEDRSLIEIDWQGNLI